MFFFFKKRVENSIHEQKLHKNILGMNAYTEISSKLGRANTYSIAYTLNNLHWRAPRPGHAATSAQVWTACFELQ